jgi:hypothetical protein
LKPKYQHIDHESHAASRDQDVEGDEKEGVQYEGDRFVEEGSDERAARVDHSEHYEEQESNERELKEQHSDDMYSTPSPYHPEFQGNSMLL